MTKIQFEWDGDKIKQVVERQVNNYSAKEIILIIEDLRGRIEQTKGSIIKIKQNLVSAQNNVKKLIAEIDSIKSFEAKAEEIQKNKLLEIIAKRELSFKKKSLEDANNTISKDKDAYTDNQKKQMPYLNYQKMLATDKQIVKLISRRIIIQYLYETPIFNNPFIN